jgi:hypothetical protein
MLGVVAALAVAAGIVAGVPPAAATERPVANGVTAFGGAPHHGPDDARSLAAGVVGLAPAPGGGYWQVARDGGVFAWGPARFFGSAGDIALAEPIVGMAARPDGDGYWLVAGDGGVFAFGAARFQGSMGGTALNQPIVGMAAAPSGEGYWLVARDGGIFSFGDARFRGSTGDRSLEHPIVGMATAPDGDGYWLAGRDGRVFAFGAPEHGHAAGTVNHRQAPTVAIAAHPGGGYWLAHGAATGAWDGGSLFPRHRVVAVYGSPASSALGVMGQGTPQQAVQRLLDQARPYEAGGRPVIPAFELIATLATAAPGPSGMYNNPTAIDDIRPYLEAIRSVDGLLILDIQPGRADWLTEARRYEELLREPDVGLALDPEWKVGPTGRPGGGFIGSIDAADINRVSAYLAELVERYDLPEKILMIHRFTPAMVTRDHLVEGRTGIAMVFHADGIGSAEAKLADYFTILPDRFARGFKIFYQEDPRVMQPGELLGLDPPPDVITYQ